VTEEKQTVLDCIDSLLVAEWTPTLEAQLLPTQGCWGFLIRFLAPGINCQALGYSKLGYDLFIYIFRIHYNSTGSLHEL